MIRRQRIKNSQGKVWYGMHFYPGVAEYADGGSSYRVFLNDETIRNMGPTFAARPVFVEHVDGVDDDLDELRKEADGWVVESFFNQADGKHWVKFITTSKRAERAIERGFRLSNCYFPTRKGPKGVWNGVSYDYEILDGEYEHVAIVSNPRYDESVIMTGEEFKAYNESKSLELKRLANDKKGKDSGMKFKFFSRAKVENSKAEELANMVVVLPKSGVEVEVAKLISDADDVQSNKGKPKMANASHLVEVDGEKMSVADLVKKYNAACEKMDNMDDEDDDDEEVQNEDDEESVENEDDESVENEDDEEADKKAKKKAEDLVEHEEEELAKKNKKKNKKKNDGDDLAAQRKKRADKEAGTRLRNANKNIFEDDTPVYETSDTKVARGKQYYGS